MNFASFAAKNAFRNKFRTILTAVGVAIAVLAFVLLRTVVWAYTMGGEVASKDRVITRHKVTFVMTMPKRYVDTVREAQGVTKATWANWFGGKDPKHEGQFFGTFAVDPKTYLDVYDEMSVGPAELEAWRQDRQGAIVGKTLAQRFGWKIGDKVSLTSQIFPGDWEFRIAGIYHATRKSIDESQFLFHWDYMNESVPPRMRDQVGWIVSRVDDPSRSAALSVALDKVFAEKDIQTLSQSERAFNMSFLGMFSAILKAIDVISVVILVIMMLILGNTIAMGVRERTQEYGVLRAIGFLPKHLSMFIVGESLTIGLLGGALGLLLSYPIVEKGLGRWIEENMGGFFPYFRIAPGTAAVAIGLALVLGILAAALPARRAAQLKVVDALRHVA